MHQSTNPVTNSLSRTSCYVVLCTAFLGWAFAGVHMSINGIVMRVATADLMHASFVAQGIAEDSNASAQPDATLVKDFDRNANGVLDRPERRQARESVLGQWFGWFTCAFLFGAATGGLVFGYVGDRFGRAKAMAASILCYSAFSGVSYFADSAFQLLLLRYLTCMGIGGMWPNGIALISEAWSNVSRPVLSGIMGTAANVGILAFGLFTVLSWDVTPDDWRWTFLVGAAPTILGLFSLAAVPESPRWKALQLAESSDANNEAKSSVQEIFRPPLLKTTTIGILLGAVPLFGGWGVSNWASAWASEVGDQAKTTAKATESPGEKEPADASAQPPKKPNPVLKSMTVVARSLPGSVSSLLGGALAFWLGRKRTYLLLCIGAFVCTQFLFSIENPADSRVLFAITMLGQSYEITEFLGWTFGLGFFSGFFFGWLPLCLPEMFPTRVRATGAGVSFNWGRILTAIGVLLSAIALKQLFQGRYADVGRLTGFVYMLGILVIWMAPVATTNNLDE